MNRRGLQSFRKQRTMNDYGSIEGLPLQLMIMGIIASLATAIILGWISSIDTPIYIGEVEIDPRDILVTDADGDGIFAATVPELRIRVLDTGGDPIGDVSVILEGMCIDNEHHRVFGRTNGDGFVEFRDIDIVLLGNRISTVTVSVVGQGIASDYWTEIMVLPS